MNIIISPHPDDEIIGCFRKLEDGCIIIYDGETPLNRREEALKLKDEIQVVQLFLKNIPSNLIKENVTFYFPDPVYEIHPLHRQWGVVGESFFRNKLDVIFYTVNKQAHYIHVLADDEIKKKEDLLNKIYPSQKSLWEHEKKYILFEGYCKWMF